MPVENAATHSGKTKNKFINFFLFEQESNYLIKYNIFNVISSFMTGAYGPLKRLVEPSMNRRNPAPDRLPAARVARGGKGKLPVNQ